MKAESVKTAKIKKSSRSKATPAARETREALLAAGLKHFAECGFKAASVHDIAKDAGVNVSLVSYHFGNKDGLFKSCFEQAGVDRLAIAERLLATVPASLEDVRVRLGMFVDEMLLDGVKNPEICAILNRDLHSEFTLIEDEFNKTFLRTFQLLAGFLESARIKGILSSWINPKLSAIQLAGSVIHAVRTNDIRHRILGESLADAAIRAATGEHIIRTHLEGLRNRPTSPPSG